MKDARCVHCKHWIIEIHGDRGAYSHMSDGGCEFEIDTCNSSFEEGEPIRKDYRLVNKDLSEKVLVTDGESSFE